jgi:hypothetical protein
MLNRDMLSFFCKGVSLDYGAIRDFASQSKRVVQIALEVPKGKDSIKDLNLLFEFFFNKRGEIA